MARHESTTEAKVDNVAAGKDTGAEENFDPFQEERGLGKHGDSQSSASSVKPEYKMDEKTRESAISVINKAFGEGGLNGSKGSNPEIDPAKHLKQLKDILQPEPSTFQKYLDIICEGTGGKLCTPTEPGSLVEKLNTVIKEDKLSQLEKATKEATGSGSADINTMFKIYDDGTSARRGIPTAEGDPAGDGFQWGRQETMKKFPELKEQKDLTPEAKKFWIEQGLAYEAGRYTVGLSKYLADSTLTDAEHVLGSIEKDDFEQNENGTLKSPMRFTEDTRSVLLESLGNPKDENSLNTKLTEALRSHMTKESLLPAEASAEKILATPGLMHGLDAKESVAYELQKMKQQFNRDVTAKEAVDLLVSMKAEQIKQFIGPLDALKK